MAKKMRKSFKRIVEPVVNKPIKREDVGGDEFLFEKKLNEVNNMIESLMSVLLFFVLPLSFLVSLGKGHTETIEGVPPYPKNK